MNSFFVLVGSELSGERLDVRWNSWEEIPEMLSRRHAHELVAMNTNLYALGGSYPAGIPSNTVEKFDTHSQDWNSVSSKINRRSYFGAAVIDGLPKLTFN